MSSFNSEIKHPQRGRKGAGKQRDIEIEEQATAQKLTRKRKHEKKVYNKGKGQTSC